MHSDLKHNNKQQSDHFVLKMFTIFWHILTSEQQIFLYFYRFLVEMFLYFSVACSVLVSWPWTGSGLDVVLLRFIILGFTSSFDHCLTEGSIENCAYGIFVTVRLFELFHNIGWYSATGGRNHSALMFIKMNERGVLMFLSHKLVNRTTVEREVLALWLLCILLIV